MKPNLAFSGAAYPGLPTRVLLVDDEPLICRSLGRCLERSGFIVSTALSATAAMETLRSADFDVVITDLRMPGMRGEELYRHICAEFPKLNRRVIFTSGDLTTAEAAHTLARTQCPGFQKPFDLSAFIQGIDTVYPRDVASPAFQHSGA